MDARGDSARGPERRRPATIVEPIEDIRALLRRPETLREGRPPSGPPPEPPDDTRPFRPTRRPGMALLTVLDDGEETGEVVRIRGRSFVIGRVEGDLVLPHDAGLSGRHAEIARGPEAVGTAWTLRDLGSTNGTFVRVASAALRPGHELLIGGGRFRFEASPSAGEAAGWGEELTTTRPWRPAALGAPARGAHPALVELLPEGEGRRHPLDRADQWVGRDPARCSVVLADPTVNPRHVRLVRNERGAWQAQAARTLNGLWLRVDEVSLGRSGQFQCGEQRFAFRVP